MTENRWSRVMIITPYPLPNETHDRIGAALIFWKYPMSRWTLTHGERWMKQSHIVYLKLPRIKLGSHSNINTFSRLQLDAP